VHDLVREEIGVTLLAMQTAACAASPQMIAAGVGLGATGVLLLVDNAMHLAARRSPLRRGLLWAALCVVWMASFMTASAVLFRGLW
jgi:hypothetical protein